MKDKRVLIISSEVVPYLPQTDQAIKSFQIPKTVNENGGQTRIFMPRYGLINICIHCARWPDAQGMPSLHIRP